jgi:site-specific recombinase XerD
MGNARHVSAFDGTLHAITGGLILGVNMARNTIKPGPMETPPAWLQTFLDQLAADDLSAATRRGYRYDLLQFIAWYTGLNNAPPELARLTEHDLITWRQHMVTRGGLKAASTNRRLEAVRRLLRWAEVNGGHCQLVGC